MTLPCPFCPWAGDTDTHVPALLCAGDVRSYDCGACGRCIVAVPVPGFNPFRMMNEERDDVAEVLLGPWAKVRLSARARLAKEAA